MAMSRTHFWTILIGTDPTSFRARDKDTLIPTLTQLQRRHPDTVIKWFERGQLFDSPEQAVAARDRLDAEKRPRDWRPGGEHRDPRAKYQKTRDEKRREFKARARQRPPAGFDPERKERGSTPPGPSWRQPPGDQRRERSSQPGFAAGRSRQPGGGAPGTRPDSQSRPRPPRPVGPRGPQARRPKKPREE